MNKLSLYYGRFISGNKKLKTKNFHAKYLVLALSLVLSLAAPLIVSDSSASASQTFSNFAITSSYKAAGQVTAAGGSLWYTEVDPAEPSSSLNYYDIGNMTTSGAITNYNIRTLSGDANLVIGSITTGPDGNVWFTAGDGSNALAGVLNISTGTVTMYISLVPIYGTPGDIVAGSDGNLYYFAKSAGSPADTYILEVNPSSGTTSTAYTLDTYVNITGLAATPNGYLWVSDEHYNQVTYYPVVGGSGGGYYTLPGSDSAPTSITSGPNGTVWLSVQSTSGNKAIEFSPSGSSFSESEYAAPYTFHFVAGPDGTLWFIDGGGTKIGRITNTGIVTEYAIPGTSPSINNSNGLTVGPDGALWFSYQLGSTPEIGRLVVTPDFSSHSITTSYRAVGQVVSAGGSLWYKEVDPAELANSSNYYDIGNVTTSGTITNYNIRTLSGYANLVIGSLVTGPDGNVWFTAGNGGNALAGVLNISTGTVTIHTSSVPIYNTPGTIVTGSDGNLYYYAKSAGSPANTYILEVNPTTGVTSTADRLDTYANVTGFAATPNGYLWVADNYYHQVTYYPVVGGSGGGSYSLTWISSVTTGNLATGPSDTVWLGVYSGSTRELVEFTPSGSGFSESAYTAPYLVQGVAGPDGALWFIDNSSSKIDRITTSGVLTQYSIPGTSPTTNNGNGLTLGPDGALWFSYQVGSTPEIGRLGY